MRLKCMIFYDGYLFNGYQVQLGKRMVQDELEKVLVVLYKLKDRILVVLLGRIDSGVYVVGQVIYFDILLFILVEKWLYVLNVLFLDDIVVKQVEIVDDGFYV